MPEIVLYSVFQEHDRGALNSKEMTLSSDNLSDYKHVCLKKRKTIFSARLSNSKVCLFLKHKNRRGTCPCYFEWQNHVSKNLKKTVKYADVVTRV